MQHPHRSRVAVTLVLWAGLAMAAGATGAFTLLKPPAPQLVILGLTLAAIFAATRVASVRSVVDTFSLRALISIHVVRFVGAVFLLLSARGALSPLFATRAGWGDIVAAAAAVVLLAFGPPTTRGWRVAILVWNTFGVLDLVVAVSTATIVVFRGDVPGMEPLFRVPLILVPTFFVPLLLAGHVLIYGRLLGNRSANAG